MPVFVPEREITDSNYNIFCFCMSQRLKNKFILIVFGLTLYPHNVHVSIFIAIIKGGQDFNGNRNLLQGCHMTKKLLIKKNIIDML